MTYRTGDYLAVLASNPPQVVERAIRRFGLANDSQVVMRKSGAGATTSLPVDYPVSVYELLSNYVELNQPATRAQVARPRRPLPSAAREGARSKRWRARARYPTRGSRTSG